MPEHDYSGPTGYSGEVELCGAIYFRWHLIPWRRCHKVWGGKHQHQSMDGIKWGRKAASE